MCSNAGFMLAFCPRRLFNIIIFMQKSTTFFSTQRKIFSSFSVWTSQKSPKRLNKERVVDEKK
jgi:hypothetical protein